MGMMKNAHQRFRIEVPRIRLKCRSLEQKKGRDRSRRSRSYISKRLLKTFQKNENQGRNFLEILHNIYVQKVYQARGPADCDDRSVGYFISRCDCNPTYVGVTLNMTHYIIDQ